MSETYSLHGILVTRDGEYQLCSPRAEIPVVAVTEIPHNVCARYDRVMLGSRHTQHPEYAALQAELYGLAEAAALIATTPENR